jgi:hypothetical protein
MSPLSLSLCVCVCVCACVCALVRSIRYLKYACNASVSWGVNGSGDQVCIAPPLGCCVCRPPVTAVVALAAFPAERAARHENWSHREPCKMEIRVERVHRQLLGRVLGLQPVAA